MQTTAPNMSSVSKMSSSSADITSKVQASYDQIAESYTAWAESRPSPRLKYVDKLLSSLPSRPSTARVLELGCGAGVPVTAYLAERVGEIVANDISPRQLELARKRVLSGNAFFVSGSMLDLDFGPESYDAVVAFFSLFHLPLPGQRSMLQRVYEWLKPGGVLVCNFGAASDSQTIRAEDKLVARSEAAELSEGSTSHWNDFFGAQMFWANMGTEGSLKMLKDAGFEIVESGVLVAADGDEAVPHDDPDAGVEFVWVVARKAA